MPLPCVIGIGRSIMKILPLLVVTLLIALEATVFATVKVRPGSEPASKPADRDKRIPMAFSGGFDTDPRDHGRPVALIAAALKVPEEVFRKAFSNVRPAPAGHEPDPQQVRKNKEVLLRALSPYGVTNERLDEVSNYYRYRPGRELWRHAPAVAYATVRDGMVTGVVVTDPGSGYSSPPIVSIPSMSDVKLKATIVFGTDFAKNGSIKEILVEGPNTATDRDR
jgi:hypothetical protein